MHYSTYQPKRPSRSTPSNSQTRSKMANYHITRYAILLVVALVIFSLFNTRSSHARTVTKHYKPQTVCIDPGHGGTDPGATTTDGTITERDINLIVAQRVQKNLDTDGYRVFMTRTSNDQTLSNHDRYTYCNNQHATIMVSIHHNYFGDSSVDYAAALFYKGQDQALATSILNSVATKLGISNDSISQFEDGVLSESKMPAALSEGFFITSDDEYNKLTAPHSQRLNDEADAITTGIINYFTEPVSKKSIINTNPQVIERDDTGA